MKPRSCTSGIIAAGLVVLASCRGGGGEADEDAPGTPAAPAHVKVARVERGPVADFVALTGRVVPRAEHDTLVGALVGGRLRVVSARVGESVRKGEVIAQLDAGPLDQALEAARAEESRAEAEARFRRSVSERTKGLVERGVAARQEAESDEAEAAAAESAVLTARTTVADARRRRDGAEVRAPFDGVVLRVLVHEGEDIEGPGTPIVEIADPNEPEIAADATGAVLGRLRVGNGASLAIDGAAVAVDARIVRVAHAVAVETGLGEVRLAPAAGSAPLLLGMSVRVTIAAAADPAALRVPLAAIRRGPTGAAECVAVEGGHADVRAVTVGRRDEHYAEIREGLAEGDVVVTDDPVGIENGTPLEAGP